MAASDTCLLKDILSLDITEDTPTTCYGKTAKSTPCQEYLSRDTRVKAQQLLRESVQFDRAMIEDKISKLVNLLIHKKKHRQNGKSSMKELKEDFLVKLDAYFDRQHDLVENSDSHLEISTWDIISHLTPITHVDHPRTPPRSHSLQPEDRVKVGEFRSGSGAMQDLSRRLDDGEDNSVSPSAVPGPGLQSTLGNGIIYSSLTVLLSIIYSFFQQAGSVMCVFFFSRQGIIDSSETGKVKSGSTRSQLSFGVKGSLENLSRVIGLFFLCLVVCSKLAVFLLGSWGFVIAALSFLVWPRFVRSPLPLAK